MPEHHQCKIYRRFGDLHMQAWKVLRFLHGLGCVENVCMYHVAATATTTKIAPSQNQTTGKAPNIAPNHENAEVPDFAREADGAQDVTDVREPRSQIKLQVFSQTADQRHVRPSTAGHIIQYGVVSNEKTTYTTCCERRRKIIVILYLPLIMFMSVVFFFIFDFKYLIL